MATRRAFKKFMGFTILGGLIFLGLQAYEWTHLIGHTLPEHNLSFSKDLFATTFFVLTGFHGMHVTGGVIYNTLRARRRQPRPLSSQTRGDRRSVLAFRRSGVDPDLYFCLFALAAIFEEPLCHRQPIPRPITSRFSISSWCSRSSKSRIVYLHLPKMLLVGLLIILAVWKAALVAMHFMHLKFEKKTLIDRCHHTVCPVRFPDSHVAAGYFPPVISALATPGFKRGAEYSQRRFSFGRLSFHQARQPRRASATACSPLSRARSCF